MHRARGEGCFRQKGEIPLLHRLKDSVRDEYVVMISRLLTFLQYNCDANQTMNQTSIPNPNQHNINMAKRKIYICLVHSVR